jgi:hypothetical protein
VQAILAFSIVAALGLASGSLGIRGVRLGVAGVLFAGIFFGQLGMQYRRTILEFVRDFGLLLFCLYGWAAGRARFPFFGEAQRSSAQCLRRRCCFTGRTDRGWISISLSLFGPGHRRIIRWCYDKYTKPCNQGPENENRRRKFTGQQWEGQWRHRNPTNRQR